jgi:hypothetical protein
MAALVHLTPLRGTSDTAETLARLHQALAPPLSQTAQRWLTLVCHRAPCAAARLSRHRHAALPGVPIPPH